MLVKIEVKLITKIMNNKEIINKKIGGLYGKNK
jgi:hypothetical protein